MSLLRPISMSPYKAIRPQYVVSGTITTQVPIQYEMWTSALSKFRAIRSLRHQLSRLPDFPRSYGKTSASLVNRGSEFIHVWDQFFMPHCLWQVLTSFTVGVIMTTVEWQMGIKVTSSSAHRTVFYLWLSKVSSSQPITENVPHITSPFMGLVLALS